MGETDGRAKAVLEEVSQKMGTYIKRNIAVVILALVLSCGAWAKNEKEVNAKYLKVHNTLTKAYHDGKIDKDTFRKQHDAIWAKCAWENIDKGYKTDETVKESTISETDVRYKTYLKENLVDVLTTKDKEDLNKICSDDGLSRLF